jgi:hypothetical protein
LEVQSFIRDLRPPLGPDQSLLVGEDGAGIGALCLLAQQEDASFIKIQVLAVAVRYRGTEGAYADEAVDVALETAVERGRKSGLDEVIIVGWIHPRNHPARRLNQRTGFVCHGTTPAGLESWVQVLATQDVVTS